MAGRQGSPRWPRSFWCMVPDAADGTVDFLNSQKHCLPMNGPFDAGSGSSGKKHFWGCKPICDIAWCPQPFRLEGPLEPPFGRTFTPDCTLQRACKPLNFHHSEYPILESHSFLERVCCSDTRGLAVASYWSGSCWWSKRRSSSSIHGPIQ